ncbi:MAG TPA: AfsR/SARP family transcriptional regulator [Asanoa sp.]|nr:AfsR/SARP family transcriptional regulator [Asanoa sp.]
MLFFDALGPLRVRGQDGPVPLGTPMQARLLALLLCRGGQPAGVDFLVSELWEGRPPPVARKTLQIYVHRLRHGLGDPSRVLYTADGYAIAAAADEFDVRRFTAVLDEARAARRHGDPAAADKLFREALGLWRGQPYGGVGHTLAVAAEAGRLSELRVAAREESAAVALDLGRPAEVVAELATLAADHPYREALRSLLMLALVRAGRQAEALDVYRQTRALLVEELGVEPGSGLRRLHEAILRADPRLGTVATADLDQLSAADPPPDPVAAAPKPRQLPADPPGFTGRLAELSRLDTLLAGSGAAVAVVSGIPGVGKTALAVRWAHRARERFPDGQLYVDLRGYDTRPPLRPAAVLALFLRAFGVPAEQIPDDPDAAAALYRSTLADRRVLIVLDNADQVAQVRPLLPASAGCAVLVTSRDQLSGLAARDGAARLPLDVLPRADAADLLRGVLGAQRVAAQAGSAAKLVDLCGQLPLALRIAAAQLTDAAHDDIAGYVAALGTGDRLTALQMHGDTQAAVRAAFDLSYARRPEPTRRLFRLLGLAPCADLTAESAAALMATTTAEADLLLAELADGHLVQRHRPGRYVLHDLLRVYAAERAHAEEPPAERELALDRLLRHYLDGVVAAARVVTPQAVRLPEPEAAVARTFAEHATAASWLDAERANVLALVTHAASRGPHRYAWQLTDALRGWFYLRTYLTDSLAASRTALIAARRAGDDAGLAAAFVCLATVHWQASRIEQAFRYFSRGYRHARAAGWAEGEATALYGRAVIHGFRGAGQHAGDDLREALAINRRIGSVRGEAVCLNSLSVLEFELGDLHAAFGHAAAAMPIYQALGAVSGRAVAAVNLGELSHLVGDSEAALRHLADALAVHRGLRNWSAEAATLTTLAAVHADLGDLARAEVLIAAAGERAGETRYDRLRADILDVAGGIDRRLGRLAEAAGRHRAALALSAHQPYPRAAALIGLARVGLAAADHAAARRHAEDARRITVPAGYRLLDAFALDALATALSAADPAAAAIAREEAAAAYRATGYARASRSPAPAPGVARPAAG